MRTQSDGPSKLQTIEMTTHIRETRSQLNVALNQCGFQQHWTQFMWTAQQIHNMRLLEHLGRFTTRSVKQSKVLTFQQFYIRLHELLSAMVTSSQNFRNLMHSSSRGQNAEDKGVQKGARKEEQQTFNENIKREVSVVVSRWCEIFRQGSLKRLIPVLCMLRMNDHNMTTHFDIEQWSRLVRLNLVVDSKSQKNCCCSVNLRPDS